MKANFLKYFIIVVIVLLTCHVQAQKTTVIINISTIYEPLDSVSIMINNSKVLTTKPIVNRQAVFKFNSIFKGKQLIKVIYGNDFSFYNSSHFSGNGVIAIDIKNRSTGKAGPLSTIMTVQEYGQATLKSSTHGIDFIIDDDRDSQGSTNDIRSVRPDVQHVVSWKQNNSVTTRTNIEICSGCRRILTYDSKTKKVTIE